MTRFRRVSIVVAGAAALVTAALPALGAGATPAGAATPALAPAVPGAPSPDQAVARASSRAPVHLVAVESVGGHLRFDRHEARSAADGRRFLAGERAQKSLRAVEVDDRVAVATTATDPDRPQQWALDQVPYESAWDVTDGSGVVVGVVDTGVKADHEDLAGRVLPGETFSGGVATAGADDANGHGTHVAGIIAAAANNGVGIAGDAPGVQVLPVRVLGADGSGWTSDVAQGITWAVDHGARVVNLSLGSSRPSNVEHTAIQYAVAHGAVVVAAAGNSGPWRNTWSYPGAYSEVVAVGSTDVSGAVSSFSTRASYVDLAAPGSNILSLGISSTSAYVTMSGTSMATPQVSAAAALVTATDPSLTPAQVRTKLLTTATDKGTPGFDSGFGWGVVNPFAAVEASVVVPPLPAAALTAPASVTATAGVAAAIVQWTAVPGASGYRVSRDGTPVGDTDPATLRLTDTGLTPGQQYTYTVAAIGTDGVGPDSAAATVTPLPVPPPSRVVAVGFGTMAVVAWSPVPGATGYRVVRNGTAVGDVTAPAVTFTQSGLAPGTYRFQVASIGPSSTVGSLSRTVWVTVPRPHRRGR
jgi:type VII secretion-associated serine protease mycosin